MNIRVRAAAALAASGPIAPLAAGSGAGGSTTLITTCGQTVTTIAVLATDLSCTGDGVVVGAGKITIDLKGFTLSGDRGSGDYGIDDSGGYDGLQVKNGVVRRFEQGVYGNGADALHVSKLVASGNAGDGILVLGDKASIASVNVSGNLFEGIAVIGDLGVVKSSTASGTPAPASSSRERPTRARPRALSATASTESSPTARRLP
jgi:hypothetical protein